MKALIALSMMVSMITSAMAADVKFECFTYEYKRKSFRVSGTIDGQRGGALWLKDYRGETVFPDTRGHKKHFYRVLRKNESDLKFAKFDIKTPQQREDKVWLGTYYRFSLPKKVLSGEQKGQFPAFFGFEYADTPVQGKFTQEQINEESASLDMDEHKGTDGVEELERMSCQTK